MTFCPKKGQKGAKVGRAVGKNQLFCIYFQNWLIRFFSYFALKLEGIKGYKLPQTPFFRKILIFSKMGKRAQNGPKIEFLDFCAELSH